MLTSENCNELILVMIQLNMDYQQLGIMFYVLMICGTYYNYILYANCLWRVYQIIEGLHPTGDTSDISTSPLIPA